MKFNLWPFRPVRSFERRSDKPVFRPIRAAYDAAQTTRDNAQHWRWADSKSADNAADPMVRKRIRERARYEYANNSYAKGVIETLAGDCIGTGPTLCCRCADASVRNHIESAWREWAEEIGLAEKLRTMRKAKAVDGETFALFVRNTELNSKVQFDVLPFEADRVTSPAWNFENKEWVDGIRLNKFGYPVSYDVLDVHPGDSLATFGRHTCYDAENVVHWFRQDRAEQHRGISEMAPALPLFAQIRRYTLAVTQAAETAADFAMVLYTDSPEVTPEEFDSAEGIPLQRNMLNMLPPGWKSSQLDPKQPCNTYPDFKREVLGETGASWGIPMSIVTGDSSQLNYASGRLDHQKYFRNIRIEQSQCAQKVLNRIFRRWYREFVLLGRIYGNMTGGVVLPDSVPFGWIWDGFEHVDPAKEASAQETRLANYTTTLAREYARLGLDWEEEVQQIAKEKALLNSLGLTMNDVRNDLKKAAEDGGNE